MDFNYSAERNVQIVLSLFKQYGIKRVIASPGAINIPVVASMQQDPYFDMFSCVDERSAAYMACGLAEETGEPVVLSCTGATSSRNYMPGLTEAFYRKLPVIALTSSRDAAWIGHLFPQVTDRRFHPNDIVIDCAWIQTIKDKEDEWDVTVKLNRVINNGLKGPIHINITDAVSKKYDIVELPVAKVIRRYYVDSDKPIMPKGNIGIFCGEHKVWSKALTEAVDAFCAYHDAVVFVDHTSKYHGKYRVLYSVVGAQNGYTPKVPPIDHIIHIGEISGAYDVFSPLNRSAKTSWRVNPDGEFRDFFKKLECVFQMDELSFFKAYTPVTTCDKHGLIDQYVAEIDKIRASLPLMPFSNLYIGQKLGMKIPDNSVLYLGILNTLRTWNFSEINPTVTTYSNVGGFGIDGTLSTAIGASYANPNKLVFVVLGDLSFFYDMNSIGNHCIGNNLRVLLINNGKGIEFRHYNHQAAFMGKYADDFVAAAGHWGNQSRNLVKHYCEDLGFQYLSASNKDEFEEASSAFLSITEINKPILFEVFTTTEDEQNCLKLLKTSNTNALKSSFKNQIILAAEKIMGEKGVEIIKKLRP